MSDRLDDKITAFVVELLDDPPPVPDLDVDAAPSGQPLESAVPRFRLRGLAVAVAAFVAVVVAVGVVALVPWHDGIEPRQPATTVSPVTTTVPASYGLAVDEMLRVEDLPADVEWRVFDETEGADSVTGWGPSEHGVLVVRCDEGLAGWRLDPSPRSHDSDKPWVRLDDALFKAMYAETAVFGEALYSSTPETVTEAFEMMKAVTLGCLTSPLSATDLAELLAMRQVGGDSIAPDIEASAADEAELLAMEPLGDDSVAIKVKWYLNRFQTRYDLSRLAIVRDGTRLLIVEEHETVTSPDDPPQVSDTEFVEVVQAAANRLAP
jgi:hypothetical protein